MTHFKGKIEEALTSLFHRHRPGFQNALQNPPVSQSSDSNQSNSDDLSENSVLGRPINASPMYKHNPTTRRQLPAPLKRTTRTFSRVSHSDLEGKYTQAELKELHFDEKLEVPEHIKLYFEIALLLIEWEFHNTKVVQPYLSPSKVVSPQSSEENRSQPYKSGLPESRVQAYLSRVLSQICDVLGLTVHDARSFPKLFLHNHNRRLSGMTDFIICYQQHILGFIEIKVFFSKAKYIPQLIVSNQALSAGINGSWNLSTLFDANAIHAFGMLWNGFQLLRSETGSPIEQGTPHIYLDSSSLCGLNGLLGLIKMLHRGRERAAAALVQLVSQLSLSASDSGGGTGGGDGTGDGDGDGDGAGDGTGDGDGAGGGQGKRRTNNKENKSDKSKGGKQRGRQNKGHYRPGRQKSDTPTVPRPLQPLQLTDLLALEFDSCKHDPLAGLLGWRAKALKLSAD